MFHSLHKLNLSIVSSDQKQDSLLRHDIAAKFNSISLKPNLINYCRLSKFAFFFFSNFYPSTYPYPSEPHIQANIPGILLDLIFSYRLFESLIKDTQTTDDSYSQS